MQEWVSINGQMIKPAQARVSVFDAGFMQGVGLFETMRAHEGLVFRLERHLDRMAASARALGWAEIPDAEEIRGDVVQLLATAGMPDARVRVTVTTGSLHVAQDEPPRLTVVITASEGGQYPTELYQHGTTAALSPWRQSRFDPTCGHKTTSYLARLASLRAAHAVGAVDALWLADDGSVAEGAISNIFALRDGRLLTPPRETPVLPGITRAAVLELAPSLEIDAEETPLSLEALVTAQEVFLTNSMMGVMPVVRIDRNAIGNEKPGVVTRQFMEAYAEQVRKECEIGEE